ncbi:MAG: hypothetical protein IJC83_00375 [Oscillospiraceae bacterium]|nr:hypothetical protein [Oscillospiraceae bacterium]
MDISKVGGTSQLYVRQNTSSVTAKKEGSSTSAPQKTDTIVTGSHKAPQNVTYAKPAYKNSTENSVSENKPDETVVSEKTHTPEVQKLLDAEAERVENFKKMIYELISKQTNKSKGVNGEVLIEIDFKTRETAKASIAEGGEYSVDAVAGRIIDFAKALSGGDKSKIETLKNAFIEGFEQARDAFGGELPEISQQTYDEVMNRFDAWEQE